MTHDSNVSSADQPLPAERPTAPAERPTAPAERPTAPAAEPTGFGSASDKRFALLVGAVVFALVAWPLVIVKITPYQDLGGHLATISILANPEKYPEFIATGLWKTNSALFAFATATGSFLSPFAIGKSFSLIVLFTQAFTLPFFVLYFRGRRGLSCAQWFFPPMVHHWFVSMGMLNFSLSISCTLWLIIFLAEYTKKGPSFARALLSVALSLVVWYCHAFSVCILIMLVGVHTLLAPTMAERWTRAKLTIVPLVPVMFLIVSTLLHHKLHQGREIGEQFPNSFSTIPWLIYDMWAHFLYGITQATISSLALALVLAFLALRGLRSAKPAPFLLGARGIGALLLAYLLLPNAAMGWSLLGARFLPYIWCALLLWIPDIPSPKAIAGIALASALYVIGINVDVIRVAQDDVEFVSGAAALPEGARLLPLNFDPRLTSTNTHSTDSASGFYVVMRHTSAHDVWANNNSMPIVYAAEPLPEFDRIRIWRFVTQNASPASICENEPLFGGHEATCALQFAKVWKELWANARKHYTHILLWCPSDTILGTLPSDANVIYRTKHLTLIAFPEYTH